MKKNNDPAESAKTIEEIIKNRYPADGKMAETVVRLLQLDRKARILTLKRFPKKYREIMKLELAEVRRLTKGVE